MIYHYCRCMTRYHPHIDPNCPMHREFLPTPESIAAAKQYRDDERARLRRDTGVQIDEDGHVTYVT